MAFGGQELQRTGSPRSEAVETGVNLETCYQREQDRFLTMNSRETGTAPEGELRRLTLCCLDPELLD
jgi:hypothetical protein